MRICKHDILYCFRVLSIQELGLVIKNLMETSPRDVWCFCGTSEPSKLNNLKRLLTLLEDEILSHKNI